MQSCLFFCTMQGQGAMVLSKDTSPKNEGALKADILHHDSALYNNNKLHLLEAIRSLL